MVEDSSTLLERLIAAADDRRLAAPTLAAYRRSWMKLLAWSTAEGLNAPTLPQDKAREYYEALTRGRSPSHHLQVKAALSFLYRVVDQPNPFKECLAPKFRGDSLEIGFLEAGDLAKVLRGLHEASIDDYFGRLSAHLADALFFTACRYHEWATLPAEKLVYDEKRNVTAVRLKVKGEKHRDLPILPQLAESLREWSAFLESYRGVRLRRGSTAFAGCSLVFPGRDGTAFSNQSFNRRLAAACREVNAPVITAHGLRHSAANLLLNERGRNIRELQELLGHQSLATTARYTHIDRKRLQGVVDGLKLT